jgi:hypothetical protein
MCPTGSGGIFEELTHTGRDLLIALTRGVQVDQRSSRT